MRVEEFPIDLTPIPGAMPTWRSAVDTATWRTAALAVRHSGGRLVALWASDETTRGGGYAVHAALSIRSGLVWLTLPLPAQQPVYPDLSDIFPAAIRMQRAACDLVCVR